MAVLFFAAPLAIGAGISVAKKKHNDNSNPVVDEVNPQIGLDESGVPTVPTATDSNGLSYGDWFCGGCRCVKDQEALAQCLGKLDTNTRR